MHNSRAMGVRGRALPLLIGALTLITAGRASADTCLLSNTGWSFQLLGKGGGSVDGTGVVTLSNSAASQGPIAAQHPILRGTVQYTNAVFVEVGMVLYNSGGGVVGSVTLESPLVGLSDSFPSAVEARTWPAGSASDFTLDVKAVLAQHFPGIDLSTATSVGVSLVHYGYLDTAVFSNLCLTDSPQYTVAPLYNPLKVVKSGAVIPLKLQLLNGGGTNLSSPALVVNATGLVQKDNQPDGTLADAGNANADNNFRYDATSQAYVYNLKTTGLAPGTWCLTFTVNGQSDPSYQLFFNVK